MARLKAEDVQRIVREELAQAKKQEEWEKKTSEYPPEVEKLWKRLRPMIMPLKPNGGYDLRAIVSEVIDTYWEVVEEDLN